MADYVTLTDVHEQLGDLGTEYDTFLGKLITRSSRDIDRLTGQFFDLRSAQTLLLDGNGRRRLSLPTEWPLATLTTLQVGLFTGASLTTIPAGQWFLEPAGRPSGWPARWIELTDLPTVIGYFPAGKRNVSLLGDWGWPATPEEIKEVALEMIVRGWRMRGSGDSDSAGIEGLDLETVPRWLSPRSFNILKKYTPAVFA